MAPWPLGPRSLPRPPPRTHPPLSPLTPPLQSDKAAAQRSPLYTLSEGEEEAEGAAHAAAQRAQRLQSSWDHASALHSKAEDVLGSLSELSD